ncbi:hypothetical protein COBT_002131 [Conglomerata obtusa]
MEKHVISESSTKSKYIDSNSCSEYKKTNKIKKCKNKAKKNVKNRTKKNKTKQMKNTSPKLEFNEIITKKIKTVDEENKENEKLVTPNNVAFFDETFFNEINGNVYIQKKSDKKNILREIDVNIIDKKGLIKKTKKYKPDTVNEKERLRYKKNKKLTNENTYYNSGYKTIKVFYNKKAIFIDDKIQKIDNIGKRLNFVMYDEKSFKPVINNLVIENTHNVFTHTGTKFEIYVPKIVKKTNFCIDKEFVYTQKNK